MSKQKDAKQTGDNSAQTTQKDGKKSATSTIDDDLVTWTGKRVRGLDGSKASDAQDGGGVGKYLKAAMAARNNGDEDEIVEFVDDTEPDPPEHARKKFKSKGGFGNFEGW